LSAPIVFQQSGNILACFTGLLLLAAASPAAAAPPTDFPYRATVIGDDAVVRSGPGETHYGTDRLAAGSEVEARDGLKERAFDYLAEMALQRMANMKEKKSELERQRRLLQRKLDAMQAGNWGLEGMLAEQEVDRPDYQSLGQKIAAVETELLGLPCSQAGLEQRFDCINATLKRPEDGLAMRQLKLHVDAMLVKVKDPELASSEPLELTELYSSNGRQRIVLFGYFPRAELPPEKDFFEEAGRILG
jgi:hypothetical protein